MIVADTNLLVYLFVASEFTERARQVHDSDSNWIFPPVALSEAANVLATLTREKWITAQTASEVLADIEKCILAGSREISMEAALDLAIKNRISVYDAQFVVLARSSGACLITADRKLTDKFPETALSMEAFIKRGRDLTLRETGAVYRTRRRRRG